MAKSIVRLSFHSGLFHAFFGHALEAVCVDCAVNVLKETTVGQVESTDDIASDSLLFVIFTPVDIRTAGTTSTVEDVGGLDLSEFLHDGFSILHSNSGSKDHLALALQKGLQVPSNPSFASPDKENIVLRKTVGCSHNFCSECGREKEMKMEGAGLRKSSVV